MLFERICRENGIAGAQHQARASPTTTGKVERWHKTVREEFLAAHEPFASTQAAQDALDAWVVDYNTVRPHQALDMASPVSRFASRVRGGDAAAQELALRLPADLAALPGLCAPTGEASGALVAEAVPVAVEVERLVPPSGNLTACGRQVWLGTTRAGQTVTIWASATTMHVFSGEKLLKTHPVTLTSADLGRLLIGGGRPGRPSPATALPAGPLAADAVVEVDRMVNNAGCVGLAGKLLERRGPAGRSAGDVADRRADGPSDRRGGAGAHPAEPADALAAGPVARRPTGPKSERGYRPLPQVQRVVAGNGNLMVAGCKLQVGQVHRGKVVTIVLEDTQFRVLFEGEELSVHPRTLIKEVNRLRASGHIDYRI